MTEARLGPYELNTIITGDARELAQAIPDCSVDLIFTDPVYDRIDDYRWLAETAARVLKPGGNLIAQSGQYYINRIYPVMDESLDYIWTIAERYNLSGAIYQYRILNRWKPYLWYSKGARLGEWVFDWLDNGIMTKSFHKWGDNHILFVNLINKLTDFSATIFDPFTGGGTVPAVCKMLGRNYLAFEIDPLTATRARERVAMTQPPLFVVQPEQAAMELV